MTLTTNEYWMSYLRRQEAQEQRDLLHQQAMFESAREALEISETEKEELQETLLGCSETTRLWVAPLITVPAAQHILLALLSEEKEKMPTTLCDTPSLSACFDQRLREDPQVQQQLNEALDVLEDSENGVQSAYNSLQKISKKAPNLNAIREDVRTRLKRTWRDLPPDELAERLSKGEILPRDEWIPGHGKQRRTLKHADLNAHLDFGHHVHAEGNAAFKNKNFDLALTRYTQGVQLLNWVEGETEEDTRRVDDLLLIFLKNQAAASLLLGEYRITEEATTTALKLNAYDAKALYRRAEAYIFLGNLPAAKNDYLSIIKSPYAEDTEISAARQGLRRIRSIVSKCNTDIRQLVTLATQDVIFSNDRSGSSAVPVPAPPDTSSGFSHDATQRFDDVDTEQRKTFWETSGSVLGSPEALNNANASLAPVLSAEETVTILETVLDHYTMDEAQQKWFAACREADFDERRCLVRIKRLIPSILGPALEQFPDQLGTTFDECQKALLRSIGYWCNQKHADIRSLMTDVYQAVLGDCTDDATLLRQ